MFCVVSRNFCCHGRLLRCHWRGWFLVITTHEGVCWVVWTVFEESKISIFEVCWYLILISDPMEWGEKGVFTCLCSLWWHSWFLSSRPFFDSEPQVPVNRSDPSILRPFIWTMRLCDLIQSRYIRENGTANTQATKETHITTERLQGKVARNKSVNFDDISSWPLLDFWVHIPDLLWKFTGRYMVSCVAMDVRSPRVYAGFRDLPVSGDEQRSNEEDCCQSTPTSFQHFEKEDGRQLQPTRFVDTESAHGVKLPQIPAVECPALDDRYDERAEKGRISLRRPVWS